MKSLLLALAVIYCHYGDCTGRADQSINITRKIHPPGPEAIIDLLTIMLHCSFMVKIKRTTVIVMMFIAIFSGADEIHNDNFDLSLSAILVFPGTIQASFYKDFPSEETVQFNSTISPAFRLVAEYYPSSLAGFGPGIAIHYSPIFFSEDIDLGYWDGRNHTIPNGALHFIGIEAGMKYRTYIGSNWSIEPGLHFGYCHTFSSSEDAINNGFTVNLSTEFQRRYKRFHIVYTLGIMTQLAGGVNDIAYVRSYPVVYLGAGMGI